MARLAPLLAALLLAAGCGGDDDGDAGSGGATGATGGGGVAEGAPYDITVGEFIAELQPQKQEILKAFVAESKVCRGAKVDAGFVLLVSAAAIDADQNAPLSELVEDQC